jgi:hypothetical protein
MKPARIGTRKPKAIPPIWNISAAHDCRLPQSNLIGDLRCVDDLVAAEREAQRDQQAARGDERDHVRHARHQPPAQPRAESGAGVDLGGRPAARGGPRRSSAPCGRTGGRGRTRLVQHLGRAADGPLDARLHERLARKALAIADLDVRREDHRIRVGDDLGVERVRTGGPLRLDVHLVAGVGRGLLQRLGRHVGVRDARGARRHRNELHA